MNVTALLQQHKNHTGNLKNGSAYVLIGRTVCDLFIGTGWPTPTRFRRVKGAWVYHHGPQQPASLLEGVGGA